MRVLVGLDEALARDVRVALGGGERSVPEQFLNPAQIGAHVEQVRREAVPERVRVYVPLRPAGEGVRPEKPRDAPRGEAAPAAIQEQRIALRPELLPAFEIASGRLARL